MRVRAEVHDSRLTQRPAEGVKLTLAHVTQLEPVGFGQASAPDRHLTTSAR